MVPEIGLKAKRIGLMAMRAGLKAKIGCHRGRSVDQLRWPSGLRNPAGATGGRSVD